MEFEGRNYFTIQSKLNSMALDVRGAAAVPGSDVIAYPYHGEDNQLWCQDIIDGVIRSKLNPSLVLDIRGDNTLVLNEFNPDEPEQKWVVHDDRIHHRNNYNRVLDLASDKICAWDYHGGDHQQWSFWFQPPVYGIIRSCMNDKVLDIKAADPEPDAKLITWDKHDDPADNQLWYQDNRGIIHSKLNDFVFDSSDSDKIRMQPYDPDVPERQWVCHRDYIVNVSEPNQCLDIYAAKDKNGAKLCCYARHGNNNQCWRFEAI